MDYILKNNLELLDELGFLSTQGWFPIGESVNVFNVFRDKDIEKDTNLADEIMTTDWYIDAILVIYPNHIDYKYKNKPNFSYKIKKITEGSIYRVNNTEEINSNNLSVELPYDVFEHNKKAILLHREIPFKLTGSLTTTSILSTECNIDMERMNSDILSKMTIYSDKMNEMDGETFNSFVNLSYRIAGIKFTSIKSVTKQSISEEEIEKYKEYKKNRKLIKQEYDFDGDLNKGERNTKPFSKDLSKSIEEDQVKANAIKSRIEKQYADIIAYADRDIMKPVSELVASFTKAMNHYNTYPLYRMYEVIKDPQYKIVGKERFMFFTDNDLFLKKEDSDEKVYDKSVIEKIKNFIKEQDLPFRFVRASEFNVFITKGEYLFGENLSGEELIKAMKNERFDSFIFDKEFKEEINEKYLIETIEKMKTGTEVTYFSWRKFFGGNMATLNPLVVLGELAGVFGYYGYEIVNPLFEGIKSVDNLSISKIK